jgi:hypothetical protein
MDYIIIRCDDAVKVDISEDLLNQIVNHSLHGSSEPSQAMDDADFQYSEAEEAKLSEIRERAIAALEVAIAQLKPKAMTGAWISIRTKGERSYYSLRRMVDGKEKEQAILASEVPIYQRRIDEGRIVVEAIKLVQMLRQMDE